MYYNGKPAVGIALSMEDGGDNIKLGENLAKEIVRIQKELPLGLELNQVANQPEVVKKSISEFSESLYEAIIIVLVVSLMTLVFAVEGLEIRHVHVEVLRHFHLYAESEGC